MEKPQETQVLSQHWEDPLEKEMVTHSSIPEIPLLGIYPKETKTERDTCIPLFIAALFTIVRTWKQLDVQRQING